MLRNRMILNMSLAGALLLLSGGAPTKNDSAECDKARTPNRVEGQVSQIDNDHQIMVVRAADGTRYEFRVAPETLNQYAVGDHILATLRSAPDCQSSAS